VDDDRIHDRIEQLVSEEHELWQREATGAATSDERRRLESLNVSLDQCWDLRRRRALRDAGRDSEAAAVRDPDVVERVLKHGAAVPALSLGGRRGSTVRVS
jgi:hypothetical protein